MKRFSLLLLLLIPLTAHGQIIMGGTSMKKDTEAAINAIKAADKIKKENLEILNRLTDKNMAMNVDEFYYIYPPEPEKGKEWPVVAYDSSMEGVIELKIVPPNVAVEINGILVGETESKWHSLPARPHYWCVFKAKKIATASAESALTAWRNAEDAPKSPPQRTNKMIVTVLNKKVPIPVPINPDNPDTPDTPVNPVNPDAALVAKFKDLLTKDKAASPDEWNKAIDWIRSYDAIGKMLSQNDTAIRPTTIEDLYKKHKREWVLAGVPPPPYLSNIRRELSTQLSGILGDNLGSLSKEQATKASEWYLKMHAALVAAHQQIK